MPFVKFTTTKTLTLQQEVSLKKVTGELISIFPNKSEEYLMVHIEDNQVMYFKGKEIECIRIVVELYRQCDMEYKKEFVKKLMKEVAHITNIPVEQQYLTIKEYDNWGMNGEFI